MAEEIGSEDIVSILDYFKELEGPRCSINCKHRLGDLIVIAIGAVVAGADGPKAIGAWALTNAEWLSRHLPLPGGIPSHDTLGRLLATLKPSAFQECFQHWIASLRGGGNYVLSLKGNQGNLQQGVADWITDQADNGFAEVEARQYTETLKGHGRTDTIEYCQFKAPDGLPGRSLWKGLRTNGVATRTSRQGDKETTEARFFISSLQLGVRQFTAAVRGHWSIENALHWCLDVTFREVDNRVRNRHAADNLAWLKRFAISLLKQQHDKETIAMRRRMAGWNTDYLAQVLGLEAT